MGQCSVLVPYFGTELASSLSLWLTCRPPESSLMKLSTRKEMQQKHRLTQKQGASPSTGLLPA
jgi:hypothetical protein